MKPRLSVLAGLALLVGATAFGASSSAAGLRAHHHASSNSWNTELASLRSKGVYVGFANEAPYAYATANGDLTGENPAVARAVLARMGIHKMFGVLTEFSSLIPGLLASRFNLITADMAILPTRCKQVAFANPDSSYGEALAVKSGNPMRLHSYADVAKRQARIAVMAGADEGSFLQAAGVPSGHIILVPDQPSALAALSDGRVDAITMTSASLQYLLDTGKPSGIIRALPFSRPIVNGKPVVSYGAVVFRKSDAAFRTHYNAILAQMKRSGQLARVIRPFGFTKQDVPPVQITAASLCRG